MAFVRQWTSWSANWDDDRITKRKLGNTPGKQKRRKDVAHLKERGRKGNNMSKYITLSSDYHVLRLNENGEIEKRLQPDDPVFEKAIGKMIESFNEARLERYLDDDMAKKCLGYTVKDKIRSIRMQFAGKKDECGNPYVKIIVETHPRALVMTKKVRAFIDDYLSAQFCDGWGEGFFYPAKGFKIDQMILAVE